MHILLGLPWKCSGVCRRKMKSLWNHHKAYEPRRVTCLCSQILGAIWQFSPAGKPWASSCRSLLKFRFEYPLKRLKVFLWFISKALALALHARLWLLCESLFVSLVHCCLVSLICIQTKLLFWSRFFSEIFPLAPPAAVCLPLHSTGPHFLWLLITVFFRPGGLQEGRWDVRSCGWGLRYSSPTQV